MMAFILSISIISLYHIYKEIPMVFSMPVLLFGGRLKTLKGRGRRKEEERREISYTACLYDSDNDNGNNNHNNHN